jgi:hypothetical protein
MGTSHEHIWLNALSNNEINHIMLVLIWHFGVLHMMHAHLILLFNLDLYVSLYEDEDYEIVYSLHNILCKS